MPAVSVVVPLYKRLQFIDAAIAGILNQTFTDWECVLVDDGSESPELAEACRRYEKQDARIKYIYQKNGGAAAARNRGVAEASGEFVVFNDDDDISLPWRLETQVNFLRQNPQAAIISGLLIDIPEDGKYIPEKHPRLNPPDSVVAEVNPPLVQLQHNIIISCCRRECFLAVGGFDEGIITGEDIDIIMRLQEKYRLASMRENFILYRQHNLGRLTRNPVMWKCILLAYLASYFRRENIAAPADEKEKLSYAKNLHDSILSGVAKSARGAHKRLVRQKRYEELNNLLGDFNAAFLFSGKMRRKVYRSLILWAFWYGKLGALPVIVKNIVK